MKKIFLSILAAVVAVMVWATVPSNLQNETLNYKVMFKWGLINKKSGEATLTLKNVGNEYHTKLTARSASWADKFFTVRDTLLGFVAKDGFKPLKYINNSHEGDDTKHDIVTYTSWGNPTRAEGVHLGQRKGKDDEPHSTAIKLEAQGLAMDMLAMYYYMRYLPYQTWGSGHTDKIHVFSGRKKELVTIKYLGYDKVKVDSKEWRCFHISFTFTTDSGKETSDGMEAWISADSKRIPIKLAGKLKVGNVHCLYTGS
ncbi:MAG: DUF3108 domain-containing protein [Bacteroidales bacterium]|nr:DUF3108 domain-containing protein [Bacteroidales bacterium]